MFSGVSLLNAGDGNILQILKRRWWKYLLLGLVDVEANYTVVKAYQYTTLTSVQVGVSFKGCVSCFLKLQQLTFSKTVEILG